MTDRHLPDDLRVNDAIDASEVRLVDREGEQLGVLSIEDARAHAADRDLELVEVEAEARPPVCRLMTTEEIARRFASPDTSKDRPAVLREIRLETADALADVHLQRARSHLERADQLKLTIVQVGRGDDARRSAREALDRVADELGDVAIIEVEPHRAGRGMAMFLEPR